MRTSFEALREYTLVAADGHLGKVKDILVDEGSWGIRYLAIDTRRWLAGRRVLLAPEAVRRVNADSRELHVDLTKEQIEASPSIDDVVPVTRNLTQALDEHFGWRHTWITGGVIGTAFPTANYGPIIEEEEVPDELRERLGRRTDGGGLLSMSDLKGYDARSSLPNEERRAGAVADAIVNAADWRVPYLVVDTSDWLPGRHMVVPTALVERIDVKHKAVAFAVATQALADAPAFHGVATLDERQEMAVLAYFFAPFREGGALAESKAPTPGIVTTTPVSGDGGADPTERIAEPRFPPPEM